VERSILAKFGLVLPLHSSIKAADMVMLATEKRDLMPLHEIEDGYGAAPLAEVIVPLSPAMAKRAFLRRYQQLVEVAVVT
jgi:hypothetical protein